MRALPLLTVMLGTIALILALAAFLAPGVGRTIVLQNDWPTQAAQLTAVPWPTSVGEMIVVQATGVPTIPPTAGITPVSTAGPPACGSPVPGLRCWWVPLATAMLTRTPEAICGTPVSDLICIWPTATTMPTSRGT